MPVSLDPRYAPLAAAALRVREALNVSPITDGTIARMAEAPAQREEKKNSGEARTSPGREGGAGGRSLN